MSQISDILDAKGRDVLRIEASATVLDAVKAMVEGNVGALIITEGGQLAGIVTERDYLRRVTLEGRDERTTPVREIMSAPFVYVGPDTTMRPPDRSAACAFRSVETAFTPGRLTVLSTVTTS